MAKGKYAARAGKREAVRDNELLAEKEATIAALTTELATVTHQLAEQRREVSTLVLRRAQELSREEVDRARHETEGEVAAHEQTRHYAATWVMDYLDQLSKENPGINMLCVPEMDVRDFLTTLVGADRIGEYLQDWTVAALGDAVSARRYRRAAPKVFAQGPEARGSKAALVARMKMDRGITPSVGEQVALENEAFSAVENLASLINKPWREEGDDEQATHT